MTGNPWLPGHLGATRARIQPDDRIRPGSAHPDWGCPVL